MSGRYRCPNCRFPLDVATLSCSNGHRFACDEAVLVLLEDQFRSQLMHFLKPFTRYREEEDRRLKNKSVYDKLPHSLAASGDLEWRLRQYDVAMLDRLLAGRAGQRVLDIGAWNGWLSNYLTRQGHRVTAADYFVDPYDGLKAMQWYSASWTAVQMDLRDLSVLDERFDVVIVNRCLQFFEDPPAYIEEARRRLAQNGLLVLTGLAVYRNATKKLREVEAFRRHLNSHNVDYFKPMKGYLDIQDKQRLLAAGIVLRPYPELWRANLKAKLFPTAPWYACGVWRPDGSV